MRRDIHREHVYCTKWRPLRRRLREFGVHCSVVRCGAMVSTLIGVVMLTFFSMRSQNALFMMLTMLSEMAGNGSEVATDFLTSAGMPIGETINPPGWMMALSLVQVVINLGLTVYVFLLAKWDNS